MDGLRGLGDRAEDRPVGVARRRDAGRGEQGGDPGAGEVQVGRAEGPLQQVGGPQVSQSEGAGELCGPPEAGGLDQPDGEVAPDGGRRAPRDRVPGGLEGAQQHLALWLDPQPGEGGREWAVLGRGDPRVQRVVELLALRGQGLVPPVTVTAHQGVAELVCPVLELEGGAVGQGAPGRVDPDAGRPAGAGAHERQVQCAGGVHGEAGQAEAEQRHGVVGEFIRDRPGADGGDPGVGEVVDQGGGVGHDQRRERPQVAQVGIRPPDLGERGQCRHPYRAVRLERGRVLLTRVIDQLPCSVVDFRSADEDAEVRQIGVHVQPAVPGPARPRGRGGDPDPGEGDHQRPGIGGVVQCRDDDFRHAEGARADHRPRGVGQQSPRRGSHPEPGVGRVVQRPRRLRRVHVRHREAASDDRARDLADRQAAGDVDREAQPQQPVGAGVVHDPGAAVHPVEAAPQRHGLLVPDGVDRPLDHQAFAERPGLPAGRGGTGPGAADRAAGHQVPGALAEVGVLRVLLVHAQFVADPAVLDQLPFVPQVVNGREPAAACRVGGDAVAVVGDGEAFGRRPGLVRVARHQAPGAPAEGGHVRGEEPQRPPVDGARHGLAGIVQHPHRPYAVGEFEHHQITAVEGQRVGHHDGRPLPCRGDRRRGDPRRGDPRRGDLRGERVQRRVPDGGGQVVRLPPAAQQVQVHLVRFGAGDRVVVGAVGELAPDLIQRRGRVAAEPVDGGERGELLGVHRRDLAGPLGLLGVDVGDVLAGVHRVHVPGLRAGPPPGHGQFGADGVEEVARGGADEPGPEVLGGPGAVDLGDPLVRRGVVRPDGQQQVLGGPDGLELAVQLVDGLLGGGEVGRGVHPPAGRVVVRHVVGEHALAAGGDPLELARELHHPGVVLGLAEVLLDRAPLVERAACPGTAGETGRGEVAGELRVMAEHVELPGGLRAVSYTHL